MPKLLYRSNQFVGVRKAKASLSHYLHSHNPVVITDRGEPRSALIPYNVFLAIQEEIETLRDMLEEFKDKALLKKIVEGRKAYQEGQWVSAHRLLSKLPLR